MQNPPREESQNSLHDLLRACVVRVDIDEAFSGTGFFVAPRRVLTCAHVTMRHGLPSDRAMVEWRGRRTGATILARRPELEPGSPEIAFWPYPDIALLGLDDDEFDGHPCVVLDRGEPREWPPDRIFALGHTRGEHDENAIGETPATLEYEGPLIEGKHHYLKLKHGDVLSGMSGGPMLNLRTGGVCAVVESRRTAGTTPGGFGVPVAAFIEGLHEGLLEQAATFHSIDRRWRVARARASGVKPAFVHHPHVMLDRRPVVGRDSELTALDAWLRGGDRAVFCLSGPGGQGKSALAWTAFDRARETVAVRVWHSFGLDSHHHDALVHTIVGAVRSPGIPDTSLGDALELLGDLGAMVVLDQVEVLFGASPSLVDLLTPNHRVVADPLVEALIRRLADTAGIQLLLTTRLRPAFLDDPLIAQRCDGLELKALAGVESGVLWESLGVQGSRADFIAATMLLRGNPLLINIAARKLAVESRQVRDIRTLLETGAAMLDEVLRQPQFQEAILGGALDGMSGRARDLLLALAASRRRLDLDEWRRLVGHLEPMTDMSRLVSEALERGLVHRAADERFELHELVADATLQLADLEEVKRIYSTLDAQRGGLFMPGLISASHYDDDVVDLESVDDLDAEVAYMRCLLDRGLIADADEVFNERLFNGLRFRLGELRVLESVVGDLRAAHVRVGGSMEDAPHTDLLTRLAVLDGRPEDALALLEPGAEQDAALLELRGSALALRGELDAAYSAAQHASYLSLQNYGLPRLADYTGFQLLGEKPYQDGARAMIDHALTLRTLASILARMGCPRAAVGVLCRALAMVEHGDQPGIRSMVYEAMGRVLLQLGELEAARAACDIALEAAEPMGVAEHRLAAAVLDLEVRVRDSGEDVQHDALDLLATTTRTGFGLLAQRCLELVGESGDHEVDAIRAAAAWQLRSLTKPVPERDELESLEAELDRLSPLHPPRRWMEWRCLRARPWEAEEFPAVLRATAARVVGSTAVQPAAGERPFDLDEASVEELKDCAILTEGIPAAAATDLLLAALPYAPTRRDLRQRLLSAAAAAGQLEQVVPALIRIASAQVDAAATLLDLANCSRLLGDFGMAAMLSDSGVRARFNFPLSAPHAVRLPLIIGFAFDLLELGEQHGTAVASIRLGLQGSPLIEMGLSKRLSIKFLGSEDEGTYQTSAEFMSQITEMQMRSTVRTLEEGSTEWWVAEIVADALGSRAQPWRGWRRRDEAAQEAARQLLAAMPSIALHTARRQAVELAARSVVGGDQAPTGP